MNYIIFDATSLLGSEILNVLYETECNVGKVLAVSPNIVDKGKQVSFGEKDVLTITPIEDVDFSKFDIAFFTYDSELAKKYLPIASKCGCFCIDCSSAHDDNKDIPAIVPNINGYNLLALYNSNLSSVISPNPSSLILSSVISPLHELYGVKELYISTYQSASFYCYDGMNDLYSNTKKFFEASIVQDDNLKQNYESQAVPFDCIPVLGKTINGGITSEEASIKKNISSILELNENVNINITCVYTPVFIGSAFSLNIKFDKEFNVDDIIKSLDEIDDISVRMDVDRVDDVVQEKDLGAQTRNYNSHEDSKVVDDIMVSRIRQENQTKNVVSMWIVANNIRKGSAVNAVDIANMLSELSIYN